MKLTVTSLRRICVFCGSNRGRHSAYAAAAVELGEELARRKIELVYGGGRVGLMGLLADTVLAGGGHVIGVIPQSLMDKEVGHRGLPDLRVVRSMHERKALMAELADGFLALPGGLGTLEEFFEVLTWAQLGLHAKPCALLNVNGFFDPLLRLLDHAVDEKFLKSGHRSHVVVEVHPGAALEAMVRHRAPQEQKWIDRELV